MLRRARAAAKWCWLYDIGPKWLSDRQLANGTARGLTTHKQVNDAQTRHLLGIRGGGPPRRNPAVDEGVPRADTSRP